ncbi:hypothetical protein [Roseibium sp.]|uniref:hypothetical protein n=1 Tax=Roseibium sp. TaxID=1936156 RepID=UPI003A9692FC
MTARLFCLGACLVALGVLSGPMGKANAQSNTVEQQVGWVSDVRGMRHFSGLRCPDIVGELFRTKVLAADADRLAGCVYSGREGLRAILRQHVPGTSSRAASDYLNSYRSSGFRRVQLSGAGAGGITFVTNDWTPNIQYETLWRFAGEKADFTVWMSYTLPQQETDIGPAFAAFTDILNRQN